MKEILRKLKEEIPYDGSFKAAEEEVDCVLLLAIKELIKEPGLVEFKESKFECSKDAPVEIQFYVQYRNKKYKYWQNLEIDYPEECLDDEDKEYYREKAIEKYGEELLTKEENKDLIALKDDYYSCKLEAPYEVYFYVESKNITTYFMKVVSPRMKIEKIKETGINLGYKFYLEYTQAELLQMPSVDPELIKELTIKHGFNTLVWDGQSWQNCFELNKK